MAPPSLLYPLGTQGKIIGDPYQGTHAKDFNVKGGSDNWESENAIDIAVAQGTPVYAVSDGTIGSQIGSLGSGGRFAGLRLHLVTQGNEFYYAHLSKLAVKAGEHVVAGQLLGYSGEANGVAHLHIASKTGDPLSLLAHGKVPSDQQSQPTEAQVDTPQYEQDTQQSQNDYQQHLDSINASLKADISAIPQMGGPAVTMPAVAGDFATTNPTSATPQGAGSMASTWQLIASNGQVSQDTIRLAGLAGYTPNGSQ